jgi:hypothetical protein
VEVNTGKKDEKYEKRTDGKRDQASKENHTGDKGDEAAVPRNMALIKRIVHETVGPWKGSVFNRNMEERLPCTASGFDPKVK